MDCCGVYAKHVEVGKHELCVVRPIHGNGVGHEQDNPQRSVGTVMNVFDVYLNDLVSWCGYCLIYAFAVACAIGTSVLVYVMALTWIEAIQKIAVAAKLTKQYSLWLRFNSRYNNKKRSAVTVRKNRKVESAARKALRNPNSSKAAKTKAGSALSQPRRTGKRCQR